MELISNPHIQGAAAKALALQQLQQQQQQQQQQLQQARSVPSSPSKLNIKRPPATINTNTNTTNTTINHSNTTVSNSNKSSTTSPTNAVITTASFITADLGQGYWDQFTDGMMFICTKDTYKECMESRIMGLPRQHMRLVRSLKPRGSAMFLFHVSDRHLRGVFQATAPGRENAHPAAWTANSQRGSPFPAQCEFGMAKEYAPLPEAAFRHLFPDGNRIRKLDRNTVRQLIQLFEVHRKAGGAKTVRPPPKEVTLVIPLKHYTDTTLTPS
jgi:hypothetical protein